MNKSSNIKIAVAFLVVLVLSIVVGRAVNYVREATDFYRWIVSVSAQAQALGIDRLEDGAYSELSAQEAEQAQGQFQDQELFDALAARIEELDLPEPPPSDNDTDDAGRTYPKLVRMASAAAHGGEWDDLLWELSYGKDLNEQKRDFIRLRAENRLYTLGSGLTAAGLYGDINDPSQGNTVVSMANMFFGFRKMAANLLWLQVDKYWHAGMLYRMVPLMHATVALDPQFVDAFLLGAWHLAYNATAQMRDTPEPLKEYDPQHQVRVGPKESLYYQGVEFLKDGIRKNPRNYKLYFDLGFAIYKTKLEDYANAVKYLSEAIRYKHDKWVPRQLYIALQLNGQYEEALAGWTSYLEANPDNANAPRFIKINRAHIFERMAREALEAGDEAQAKELKARAVELWNDIAFNDQDPYALAQVRRMEALALAEEGRHIEAHAVLDQARYEAPDHFDEISDLMIRIKKDGGIPLNLSEKNYLERKAESDRYIAEELKRNTGKSYELRDDTWFEEGYNNEKVTVLRPGSRPLNELRSDHPELNPILAFKQPLVFSESGNWYRYQPRTSSFDEPLL